MTCIELIVFIIMIMFAAFGAVKIGPLVSTRWWGILAGALIGLGAFFILILILLLILDALFGHGLPPCEEGTCTADDYKSVALDDGYCNECKHGHRYRRRGQQFVRVNDDGTETPYYMWKRFRGWRPV